MKKQTKTIFGTIVLIGVIIGVIIALYYFGIFDNLKLLTVTPSSGAQFIINPNDSSSPYTLITQNSNFRCDADECIVSGSVNFNNAIGETTIICTSERRGICIIKPYSTLEECNAAERPWYRCEGSTYLVGGLCDACGYGSVPQYGGTFNFCPSTDSSFLYCTGSQNSFASSSPEVKYTEEYKLIRMASISFSPKNLNGSDITDKYIRVKKYDLSCLPAIEDGTACDPNDASTVYCQQQLNACPSGYTFFTNSDWCGSSSDSNLRYRDFGNVCRTSRYSDTCKNPITGSNIYKKCEGNKTIGQSICGDWGTTLYTAPSPQQCFLKSTNQVGTGIGGLKCPTDICIAGTKSGVDGSTTYRECMLSGSCYVYIDKTCPSNSNGQLVFDSDTGNCVFPSINSCIPQSSECLGTSIIRNCEGITISGILGYVWGDAENCPGELLCDNKGTSVLDDSCSCRNVDSCTSGQIQCTSLTTYNICSKDPNNQNSCLKFRNLGNTIDDPNFYECRNNQIQIRSDVGCAFNTPGYECSTSKDSRGILLESCVNNICTLTQDRYSSTAIAFNSLSSECDENTVYETKKYIDGTKVFYRLELKTNVANAIGGVCNDGFICREVNNKAECAPASGFVGISGVSAFGVGENIGNLKVIVTNDVPGYQNIQITARLLENNIEIPGTRIITITNSLGEANLNFNYAHPRSGNIDAEVIAGDPITSEFKAIKTLNIRKKLVVKLNCPPPYFVNRKITCNWKAEDAETGAVITVQPRISVLQGINELVYNPVGMSIEFTPTIISSITVKLTVEKEGYLPGEETAIIYPQRTATTITSLIDNKDISTYSTGITKGTHQITLNIEESGLTPEIQMISAKMRTPSAQEVNILFSKQIAPLMTSVDTQKYVWVATYNFEQPGQTYRLYGEVIFTDISKPNEPFDYSITTSKSGTEDWWSLYVPYIIGSIIGLIILIVFIIILIVIKRRKNV